MASTVTRARPSKAMARLAYGIDGRRLADPATLLESQEGRGLPTWIEQREARVEERRRRALGEVARVVAARVRAVGVLLLVGAAVAVGVAIRAIWTGADRGVEPVGALPPCRQAIAVAVGWWQGQDMDEDVGRPVRVGDHEVRRLGLEHHGAAIRAEGRTARDARHLRACGGHAHARRELPETRSCRKTSSMPLVSPGTTAAEPDENTMIRPPSLMPRRRPKKAAIDVIADGDRGDTPRRARQPVVHEDIVGAVRVVGDKVRGPRVERDVAAVRADGRQAAGVVALGAGRRKR